MSSYEISSLILTGVYDLLTFGLLLFVAYEAVVKPRQADVVFYFEAKPKDTKQWSWSRQTMDFVVENRGPELRNWRIFSDPDYLGWGNLGEESPRPARSTSKYFKSEIPYLAPGERCVFFWCDMEANREVLKFPFQLTVEYDNPIFIWPAKRQKTIRFNFSAFDGTVWGLNGKYDVHNVAKELTRVRELMEQGKDNP